MTGTLLELFLAGLAFAGSHLVISSTPLRAVLVGALGERPFLGAYSLLSLVLLAWLIWAYTGAPYVELWDAPAGVKHLTMGVVFLASMFLACGVSTPNPTSIAGGPPKPVGIVKVTRHPVMWGIGLWGAVHLAANGDAASVMLFGWLTALALGGTVLLDLKKRRTMGEAWTAFAQGSSNVPFAALVAGRTKVGLAEIGWGRIAAGVVLYVVLNVGHEYVIGVPTFVG